MTCSRAPGSDTACLPVHRGTLHALVNMHATHWARRALPSAPAALTFSLLLAGCAATDNRPVMGAAPVVPRAALVSRPAVQTVPPDAAGLGATAPHADAVAPRSDAWPWSRFGFHAGAVFAVVDSSVRLGLPGVGVALDLEEALDLESGTETVRLGGHWRFTENRRHRLDVAYIDVGRSSTTTIGRDIELGNGSTIPTGSDVRTKLDIRIIELLYGYSFFQDDRFDLALEGGFYVMPLDFSLSANGSAALDESLDFTAPLPVAGLRMDFALTERWFLRSNINVFYLEYDDYVGAIANWVASAEYYPWDHVGFGLGVDSFRMMVEGDGETSIPGVDKDGSIEFGYLGVAIYMTTSW